MSEFRQALSQMWPPKPTFTVEDFPDQTGRVAIVTGSNIGIGKATCKVLLEKNCRVYMAARSEVKAAAAIQELKYETGKDDIHWLKLELDDLTTIKATVDAFLAKESQLHLLFNNAGVMAPPADMQTKQGYEQQLGVNVVGPFLLTKLLLPVLESTASSLKHNPSSSKDYNIVRVINTSSYGHSHFAPPGGFNFDDPNHPPGDTWVSYGQSKWANVVVANEIARRYGGKGITSHSLNPGTIKTNLAQHSSWLANVFFTPFLYPASMGCLTQLYAGLMPESGNPDINGSYFLPFGRKGLPRSDTASLEVGKRLWSWLEKEIAPYM